MKAAVRGSLLPPESPLPSRQESEKDLFSLRDNKEQKSAKKQEPERGEAGARSLRGSVVRLSGHYSPHRIQSNNLWFLFNDLCSL